MTLPNYYKKYSYGPLDFRKMGGGAIKNHNYGYILINLKEFEKIKKFHGLYDFLIIMKF